LGFSFLKCTEEKDVKKMNSNGAFLMYKSDAKSFKNEFFQHMISSSTPRRKCFFNGNDSYRFSCLPQWKNITVVLEDLVSLLQKNIRVELS
jgi:hypothetical protein